MEVHEICDLAAAALGGIVRDLNDSWYKDVGGKLQLKWSEKKGFAYAESDRTTSTAPDHSITIHYDFLVELYRRSERFYKFRESDRGIAAADLIATSIPRYECTHFCEQDFVRNMFMGSLTWVFFHEIGHLVQEHGAVKSRMLGLQHEFPSVFVESGDFEAGASLRESCVHHALELAADAISTTIGMAEWIRHASDPNFIGNSQTANVFINGIHAYACGVTSVLYLFRPHGAANPDAPTGYHPPPIYRLQLILPLLQEMLTSSVVATYIGVSTDARAAVGVVGGGAYLSALCWMQEATKEATYLEGFLFEAIASKPEALRYLGHVIPTWDEASNIVQEVAAFPNLARTAIFSDFVRSKVASLPPA